MGFSTWKFDVVKTLAVHYYVMNSAGCTRKFKLKGFCLESSIFIPRAVKFETFDNVKARQTILSCADYE